MIEKVRGDCPTCGKTVTFTTYLGSGHYQGRHCNWRLEYNQDFDRVTKLSELRKNDSQRKKLYRMEKQAPIGNRFATVKEAQGYVDRIWSSRWFRSHYPTHKRSVRIEFKKMRAWAGVSYGGRVVIHPFYANERTILHELAHEVSDMKDGAHGPEFARNFVLLVDQWHSDRGACGALRSAFRSGKVKVARPTVVPVIKGAAEWVKKWSPELKRWYYVW